MDKNDSLGFDKITVIHDDPTIWVRDGDVESAVKLLRRRMATDGTLRWLKSRSLNPKKSDRLKIKAARSERHRSRHAARKVASDAQNKSR